MLNRIFLFVQIFSRPVHFNLVNILSRSNAQGFFEISDKIFFGYAYKHCKLIHFNRFVQIVINVIEYRLKDAIPPLKIWETEDR